MRAHIHRAAAGLIALVTVAGVLSQVAPPPPEGASAVWWGARASGALALTLLGASTVFGVLVAWRSVDDVLTQSRLFRGHGFCASMALSMTVLHIVLVVLLALEVGTRIFTSLPLVSALIATPLLALAFAGRRLLPRLRPVLWRWMHRLAYLGFATATLHGTYAGGDHVDASLRWLYIVSTVAVSGIVLFRILFASHGGVPQPNRNAGSDLSSDAAGEILLDQARRSGSELGLVLIVSAALEAQDTARLASAAGHRASLIRDPNGRIAFALLGHRTERGLRELARRLEGVLAECGVHEGAVGVACYPRDGWSIDSLLLVAEIDALRRQIDAQMAA